MKKDPYLSELEKIGVLEEEGTDETDEGGGEGGGGVEGGEEPTKIDMPAAPAHDDEAVEAGTDESAPRQAPAAKEILDLAPDIPVQVVVVMGRKKVTVKDLIALRMGQVIDFDKTPSEPVDLVAGGKVIGKGELVEVDGKLGVRVLRLLK